MDSAAKAQRIEKLRYRAWRRGIRETDLILGPFADAHLAQLDARQLDLFEELLEAPDTDLYAWIVGRAPTPQAYESDVMELLRGFRFFAHAAATNADERGA